MRGVPRSLTVLLVLALCLTTWPTLSFSTRAADDTTFVRLPAAAYDVAGIPAVRALDYGSFMWLELTSADLARLRASGLPYQVYTDPFTLRLGEISFDTRQGGPDLPAGWDRVRGDGPDLHLVQLVGPTRAEWLATLQRDGLEIVQYIHPFTYVVWGEWEALDRVASADFVHWTGPFAPAYRVLPQWRDLPARPVQVDVLLYRGADADAAVRRIAKLGGRVAGRAVLNDVFEIAGFYLSGAQLQAAARIPGVYSIQLEPTDGGLRGEMSNQVNVNNVDGSNLAFPGYQAWLAGAGVDGSGVVIANVDGGIEHTHPDLVNRMLSCSGTTCGGDATDDHGTHTAGIMAADGSSGTTDSYGFLRGLGMAPGANLVEQLYSPYYTWPDGMLLLMSDSYNNGASLSGNSWGPAGSPQGYDNDTLQVDIGVRDAVSTLAGNQELSYVLSFMNGGGGTSSQGSPDEAKNIFTIGSTKMQHVDGSQDLSIDDLSSNTAHGPALDGRTIPHMVAPGCYVDSTVSIGSGSYGLMCGTSMASPHVSGAVALFIEYHRYLFGVDPSPALVKAAFLPLAHDLDGNEDADGNVLGHPFDSKQGWGRMDVAAVLSPTLPVLYFDNPLILDSSGQEWVRTLAVADPGQPMRLMLVWTDAPGHGLGGSTPAWNNDLDLVVEAGGDTYRGNDFDSDGWSQAGGVADGMNNTEGVFLGPTAAGSVTVRVVASNINSDGIPNQGDATDQDFALACYNCVDRADFTLVAEPDSFEICAPAVVTSTLQVGEVLTYNHDVTLAALNVPAGVTADVTPTLVTPSGVATLTLDVSGATPPGTHALIVSGTAEITNVHTAEIELLVSSDTPAAPPLLSPADGATAQPYQELDFSWGLLPQVRRYSFQVDTDPTFAAPVVSATAIPTGAYTLATPLEPATCYFWRALGENGCGAGDWAAPFRFATVATGIVFADDMESGAGNWSHQADQGADSWTLSTAQSYSGSYAWHVPDAASITDSYLWNTTPVSVGSGSTLTFWHRHQFESSYDGAVLEISTNGGGSWSDLGAYITANGYNGTLSTDYGNPLGGRQAWVSDLTTWTQVQVDLGSFAGQSVQVRWRIGCDSSVSDVGWYIDDVQISAPLPPNPAPTLSGITPNVASTYEDTPVQISGSGFITTPHVRLDDTWLLSVTQLGSTTLDAIVPLGLPTGVYTLTLYNGDCQEAILPDAFTVTTECVSPTVALASDSLVELGQAAHFTATVGGSPPFTYTWDFGGPGYGSGLDTARPTFTYTTLGTFTVLVTVENECGDDSAADAVTVWQAVEQVTIDGPSNLLTGEAGVYNASYTPPTATVPVTLTWDNGTPGPTAVYSWTTPGHYTLTVTATNPYMEDGVLSGMNVTVVDRFFVYLPLLLRD